MLGYIFTPRGGEGNVLNTHSPVLLCDFVDYSVFGY